MREGLGLGVGERITRTKLKFVEKRAADEKKLWEKKIRNL